MEGFYNIIGSRTAIHDDKVKTLMARWRYHSLSIHGIESASLKGGGAALVKAYLTHEFKKLASKNKFSVELLADAEWWMSDKTNPNFEAASEATQKVYEKTPDYTQEGGSIGAALDLQHV